jgi:hypothetical protein
VDPSLQRGITDTEHFCYVAKLHQPGTVTQESGPPPVSLPYGVGGGRSQRLNSRPTNSDLPTWPTSETTVARSRIIRDDCDQR